jgi:ribonucleoside-diphosphate reductase alpha chain
MEVIKRDGQICPFDQEEIKERGVRLCCLSPELSVDVDRLVEKVVIELSGNAGCVQTSEIDNLLASVSYHEAPSSGEQYDHFATRVKLSNLYRDTSDTFSGAISELAGYEHLGKPAPLVHLNLSKFVAENAALCDELIAEENDRAFDFFGLQTLIQTYLLSINGRAAERPQYMWLRVALGIWLPNSWADACTLENMMSHVRETYLMLSQGTLTHASPTLFNSGTPTQQLASCFLLTVGDSIFENGGVFKQLGDAARISAGGGGLGINWSNVRAKGSYIVGSGGSSGGLVSFFRPYEATMTSVDQGGGKRKGAAAMYTSIDHLDVPDVIKCRMPGGATPELFSAMWVSDLFMRRLSLALGSVDQTEMSWTLFCPKAAPGLTEVYGAEYDALYEQYEREGRGTAVSIRLLWRSILRSLYMTGGPYILYKDAVNRKNNQANVGLIQCSNLCTEILQYTSEDETAVCNLASVSLPKFVTTIDGVPTFDHAAFIKVVKRAVKNLDRVIDVTYYPIEETKRSNFKHRPIGIGIQGLADVFVLMGYPFESEQARRLNWDIGETLYYAACIQSCDLAQEKGPYPSFAGSPASKGQLTPDLWCIADDDAFRKFTPFVDTLGYDWAALRQRVVSYGLRNSLLVAPMPTASTSNIRGNAEAFYPITVNIYKRVVLAGTFTIVNKHLLRDLRALGVHMSSERVHELINAAGSVQNLDWVPESIKPLYKTVWEISQKTCVDMNADRSCWVCQGQSCNYWLPSASQDGPDAYTKLPSLLLRAWKRGMKNGIYYLHTRAATTATALTVGSSNSAPRSDPVCVREQGCVVCSS